MPSGRTHDSITLWSLPLIAGVTFERTHNASLTLILSGGYLFSGLMFGPDLDVHSQQYKRWGLLRWIWLPYRRSMRHRSFLSHGVLVGTLIRVVYLLCCLTAAIGLVLMLSAIAYTVVGESATWTQFFSHYGSEAKEWLGRSLHHHSIEWFALLLGLELGALSHSLSDWIGSRYKRLAPRKHKSVIVKTPNSSPLNPQSSHPASTSSLPKTPKPTPKPPSSSSSPTVELPHLPQDAKIPPFQ